MYNALDTNNNVAVILMDVLTFAVIFGFIGASFAIYTSFIYSKIDKEKKEEALKKKFFIED